MQKLWGNYRILLNALVSGSSESRFHPHTKRFLAEMLRGIVGVLGAAPDNDAETLFYTIQRDNQFPSDSIRTIRERTAEGSESNSSQREQTDKVTENEDTEICSADDTKWLNDLNLVCFAEFETERCSYTLEREAGAVRVDLEQADFGYCVGEIEALVSEGGGMNAALQKFKL